MREDVRTLLDLIQEYAALNEAKTLARGALPPPQESRWNELKRFYDMLMAQNGVAREPASRFTAVQIRDRVAARARLRVQTDLEIVVAQESEYHRARVGNLSRGGVLLHCDHGFEVDSSLTLHMANVARDESLLPTEGRVAWRSEGNRASDSFRYRLGVEFQGLGPEEERTLDSFVVDSLETKLLCLGRESLDPEFMRKERLAL
jgi:c-di-GMP-binding flagellar brake protein YcgR